MSQHRLSRDGATRASKNVPHAEWMSQRRASIDKATRASGNAAYAERSFYSWSSQHCGSNHNSR